MATAHRSVCFGVGLMVSASLLLTSCSDTVTEAAASSTAQDGGPIVVVVLADHYTSGQESAFNLTVTNLFDNGLFADSDFDDHKAAFTIVKVFQPWDSSSSSSSNYGFGIGGSANCSVSWVQTGPPGTTTAELIEAAAGAYNPTHVVVVGNYTFDFGCTYQKQWTYIAAGAVGSGVLPHEFGHLLAELFDEYSLAVNDGRPYPQPLNCRNCSTVQPPHWAKPSYSGFVNAPPCDYYSLGIVHPYAACKMARMRVPFCPVCRDTVNNAIAFYNDQDDWNSENGLCPVPPVDPANPGAPGPPGNLRIHGAGLFIQPPTTQSIVRVLVTLDRKGGTARAQRVTEAKGRFIAPDRRLGTLAYEVLDGDKLLAVGVLQGDPFQVRDYRGGARHDVSQTDTASVVVLIPNETKKDLSTPGRAVQIAFYRLTPSVTAPRITRQVWQDLKTKNQVIRFSSVSPDELRRAM